MVLPGQYPINVNAREKSCKGLSFIILFISKKTICLIEIIIPFINHHQIIEHAEQQFIAFSKKQNIYKI